MIKTGLIHFQHLEGFIGDIIGDDIRTFKLGHIADALQEAIRNTRGSPRTAGNLKCPTVLNGDFQYLGSTFDDGYQRIRRVIFQAGYDAKTVA